MNEKLLGMALVAGISMTACAPKGTEELILHTIPTPAQRAQEPNCYEKAHEDISPAGFDRYLESAIVLAICDPTHAAANKVTLETRCDEGSQYHDFPAESAARKVEADGTANLCEASVPPVLACDEGLLAGQ